MRKILIVRLGSLGDIAHAVPAQQLLAQLYPDAEIHWLTEPPYAGLLRCVESIHRVWRADTQRWRRRLSSLPELFRLVNALRREQFDLCFDLQGLLKSALLARASGARRIIGFPVSDLREPQARFFYNQQVQLASGNRHQIERTMDLVSPPRYEGQVSPLLPLRIPESDLEYVAQQLERIEIQEAPILLNPGAGWPTKRWSPERFGRLALRLENDLQIPVLMTYGPNEERLLESSQNSVPEVQLKAFPTTILQLAAICQHSRLMVAGDTGPLHLAVGVGTPTVAIIGPGYPWRTGPFGTVNRVVSHPRSCPHPYSRQCRDHFCMDIPVDAVFDEVRNLLHSQ